TLFPYTTLFRSHDQAVTARQAEHRVFRAADHFLDGVASEGAEQPRLRHPAQHVRLGQTRARDPVALEPRGELPDDRLNLGQLRHGPPWFPATRCHAGTSFPET